MRRQLLPALRMVLVLTVVLGLAYPLVVTLVAQGVFNGSANGSLVKVDGQVVGSKLLGQTFTGNQYFQSRPSAAGTTASGSLGSDGQPGDPKDLSLSNSGGSNYGPNNSTFLKLVSQRVAAYRKLNGLSSSTKVPVDAVTSSASGVDPEISVANARPPGPAGGAGPPAQPVDGEPPGRHLHRLAAGRCARRSGRERARAQPGPGPGHPIVTTGAVPTGS